MPTTKYLEQVINQHRIQHKVRILWPDFEVYDLIQSNIKLQDIRFFTSNPIHIVKIDNIHEQLHQVFRQKGFTHMAISKVVQLDAQMELVDTFYAILSKRGLAIDQYNSRFIRGNYVILVNIAQVDRQISLWGIQSVTDQTKLIGPKLIIKKNSMWTIQFESSKPLKNILLYSTKREPRYGKNTFYQCQLPKDAKLQYCMKIRIFTSYMESLMNKQEILLSDTFFLVSKAHKPITFTKNNLKIQEQCNKTSALQKIKMPEHVVTQLPQISQKRIQKVRVKLVSNSSSFLQIAQIENKYQAAAVLQQIKVYISKAEQILRQQMEQDQKQQQERKIISQLNLSQIKSYNWNQLSNLMKIAKQLLIKQFYDYMLAIKAILMFQNQYKSIENWIQLRKNMEDVENVQMKQTFQEWSRKIMVCFCRQFLKDSDDQIYDQIIHHKELIVDCIALSLEKHHSQNTKISDLLYILMLVSNKRDIFHLYHAYSIPKQSLLLASSLRMWQQKNHFYFCQNFDALYQTQAFPPFTQLFHQPTTDYKSNNKKKTENFDFSIKLVGQITSKNSFISGKSITVKEHSLHYFIYRKQDQFYCFIEQIHSLSNVISQPKFTSYQITIQMKIDNETIQKQLAWNFTSPSVAVGSKFIFQNKPLSIDIQCKLSFKRNIIHDSILNYLRIRFQELVRLQNKCSIKIQQENKRLSKRRSSLFLQKNLFPTDFQDKIERQCFLHKSCSKCQKLCQQASIYQLNPLDMYNLILFAPFKDQLDALLITIKYLIINPKQMINKHFWLSHIRIKYLNLHLLLKLINNNEVPKQILQMFSSLVDEKIKQNAIMDKQLVNNIVFVKPNECRIGISQWQYCEQDYSEDYLAYIQNIPNKL